jgi:signal peptide peptidase SppA
MKYARTAGLFFNTPLALLPAKADEICTFWEKKIDVGHIDWEAHQEPFAALFVPEAAVGDDALRPMPLEEAMSAAAAAGGGLIAVLPLYGMLSARMNLMMAMSGGTSTTMFAQALREQVDNPQVKAVIVDADSPGGAVAGMQELADVIYGLRGKKPIVAVVNHLAASAAYNAITQMDEIVASPSAELGHIGVAALLIDRSAELEQAGIKVRQVTAGKFKHEQAIGSDLVPMDDSKIQHAQQQVDEAYGMFVANVARGRGVTAAEVRNGFGEGRVVGAKEAVRLGMADRIATLDETIQRFANGGRVSRRGSATLVESEGFAAAVAEMERDFLEGSSSESEEPRGIMSAVDPAEIETQHRELAYQYEGVTR